MEINKIAEGKKLTVELIGRLDAVTAIELQEDLKDSLDEVENLIFDLAKLNYIASAGLRVLLKYQKHFDKLSGEMEIKNVKTEVRDVLDMTGFSNFLNIIDSPAKKLSIEF